MATWVKGHWRGGAWVKEHWRGRIWVNTHHRKDGTRVKGHWRKSHKAVSLSAAGVFLVVFSIIVALSAESPTPSPTPARVRVRATPKRLRQGPSASPARTPTPALSWNKQQALSEFAAALKPRLTPLPTPTPAPPVDPPAFYEPRWAATPKPVAPSGSLPEFFEPDPAPPRVVSDPDKFEVGIAFQTTRDAPFDFTERIVFDASQDVLPGGSWLLAKEVRGSGAAKEFLVEARGAGGRLLGRGWIKHLDLQGMAEQSSYSMDPGLRELLKADRRYVAELKARQRREAAERRQRAEAAFRADANFGKTWVNSYYRNDGTHVSGHWRRK